MNEKKAVELAQESGAFVVVGHNVLVFTLHQFLRFAELVEQDVKIRQMPKFEELARFVRREEREECAKLCLSLAYDDVASHFDEGYNNGLLAAAAAIRVREPQ